MKVNTQSVNFNAEEELLNFVQKRMDKMDLFYDRVVSADVFLKMVNTSAKENKSAEVKLHVPGDVFVVKKQCRSFEEAVDAACDSLERKLVKKKRRSKAFNTLKFF